MFFANPYSSSYSGSINIGFEPLIIKAFITDAGLSRTNITVESSMLEYYIREDLKLKTNRIMAITNPLEVVIDNYPEGEIEYVDALNNAENEELGSRKVAFGKHLYIEREDFVLEKPNKHYKRLALGLEVRLYHAYFIKAESVEYDENGEICLVHCTYDVNTKSGSGFNERKPNGTIQFVEKTTARKAKFNKFEPLMLDADKDDTRTLLERVNPNSWTVLNGFVENAKKHFEVLEKFQFIRDGYYTVDNDSTDSELVFNILTMWNC